MTLQGLTEQLTEWSQQLMLENQKREHIIKAEKKLERKDSISLSIDSEERAKMSVWQIANLKQKKKI